MKSNHNIASTQITEDIRVSTAAIYYDEWFGERWQIETFIFSNNKTLQKTRMIIHGSESNEDRVLNKSGNLIEKAIKVHNYISRNLISEFCE